MRRNDQEFVSPRCESIHASTDVTLAGTMRVSASPFSLDWRITSSVSTGIMKQKVLPTPALLSTQILPPCSSMMCLAIARPIPSPPA